MSERDTIKVEYEMAGKAMEQRGAWIELMIRAFMQQHSCGIEDIELCERMDDTGLCWFIRKREPVNRPSIPRCPHGEPLDPGCEECRRQYREQEPK